MSHSPQGKIVTFYSYKGGTGRTTALANVAWILAGNGKKVLVVDWDLESPGLHKFFQPFLDEDVVAVTPGIIELINEYAMAATENVPRGPNWHTDYARLLPHAVSLEWEFPGEGTLDFVSAGRQNRDYSALITSMDWDNFYGRLGGGVFFDALKADMKRNYDYALIDSRTGLSDIADICTVHFPDILVDCFTLSDQSIEGAAAVARHIDERYRERAIRILPVPMRVDYGENAKVEAGRSLARSRFDRFPKGLSPEEANRYWLAAEVPYRPFYAFEETLAVFGDAPGSPNSMLAAYERLSSAITQGEVMAYPGVDESLRLATLELFARRDPDDTAEVLLSYVSSDRPWADWIAVLLERAGLRVRARNADMAPLDDGRSHADSAGRVAVLLSPAYLQAEGSGLLWEQAFVTSGPLLSRRLTVLRVLDSPFEPPFTDGVLVDLVGLGERQAVEAILRAFDRHGHAVEHPAEQAPAGPRYPGAAGPVPEIWNVGTRNAAFTGRGAVLERLRDQMTGTGQTGLLPQVLHGLGGVGKTQVALEYAHRFKTDYDLVWWIPAEQPDQIRTALSTLARRLGLRVGDNVAEAAELAREALRRNEPFSRWMLIFDNADDPRELANYLPGGGGHVLITSRNQAWAQLAAPVELDVFTSAESVEHLMRRVPGISHEDAFKISTALGYLPLAVEQAAGWLEVSGTPTEAYLQELEQQTTRALAMEAPPGYPEPVAITWNLSFERLRDESPAAARLLQLCAFFAADPIAMDLIYSDQTARLLVPYDPSLREKLVLGRIIRRISRYALAKVDQGNNSLQVHRLVQAVIRSRMTDAEQEAACHDVHAILLGARPKGDPDSPESWPAFDQIIPHVWASRATECAEEDVRQLLIDLLRYQWKRGNYDEALEVCVLMAEQWAELLGEDHWQLLYLRSQLANVLRSLGRADEALVIDQDVLDRQRRTLGEDHPHTLMTAGNLAADLRVLGQFGRALAMDQDTYDRSKDIFGEDYPRTLIAANNLAVSLRLVGDCFRARDLDRETLDRRVAVLGRSHPYTLFSAANLARDMREAGDFAQSAELLRTTYVAYQEVLGDNALETLRTAKSLAVSLRKAGMREEAKQLAMDTCTRYARYFADSQDAVAADLELACCLSALGDKTAARGRTEQILVAQRESLGSNHPYTLGIASNLVVLMRTSGDLADAYELGSATLERLRSTLGETHPFTLSCAVNVGNCLADLGRYAEAADLEMDTIEKLSRTLGTDHPDTLACKANHAVTLDSLGRRQEAANLRQTVVEAFAQRFGEEHPNVEDTRTSLRLNRDLEPQPT
jgi:tetratricopeptide (TPR) repeat protein